MQFSGFIHSILNDAKSKDDLIEVDEEDNIYVGTYLIQKIKIIYINDSLVSCIGIFL
jgi:archaeosine-15-forming tRNA-guanine transglycosylase